jgi:hypothetical protein
MENPDKFEFQCIYKYRLPTGVSEQTDLRGYGDLAIPSHDATPWVALSNDGVLSIRAEYSWDGCTMVPDPPGTQRASLYHDALYQLHREGLLPLRARKQSDVVFKRYLVRDRAPWWARLLYYRGVRVFGGAFARAAELIKT